MLSLTISSDQTASLSTLKNIFLMLLMSFMIASCATKQPAPEPVATPEPKIEPTFSSLPLEGLSEVDLKFAQAALDQLGYRVLFIDGIWGPRSEAAIRQFEQDNQLVSANGRLSELNFTRLTEATTLTRGEFEVVTPQITEATGIAAKLDSSIALSASPQLIITDLSYSILAKPNPYSETIKQLPQGAGLYIISLRDGWYEVETLERLRGYIRD